MAKKSTGKTVPTSAVPPVTTARAPRPLITPVVPGRRQAVTTAIRKPKVR